MSNREEMEGLIRDIDNTDAEHAREAFTALFQRGWILLKLDDKSASFAFGTSQSNVSRWRRGIVVPPAARMVLRILRNGLAKKCNESNA